ncbi:MAG: ABC transporter permease [Terracidiphilus sp.]
MATMSRLVRRLAILLGRRRFRSDLDEEMAFHREQAEREYIAGGMKPEDARFAALRRFGNTMRIQEKSGEVVGFNIESIVQDLRFALRQLRNNPGFAITAVLILALGIGASAAIFAFVDAALIKPLPYADPTRLARITESDAAVGLANISYPDYVDWKRLNHVFASMDAFTGAIYGLSTPSGTQNLPGVRVTAGFFRTLGVTPVLGRDFRAGEDLPGAPGTVMLTYGAWQRRFGGRTDVIGQSVRLSGEAFTIIGVLPRGFEFALRGTADFWTPLQPTTNCEKIRECHSLYGIGRLKDGVPMKSALAEMQSIAQKLEIQYPDSNRGRGASVMPLSEAIIGDVRPIFLVLLGGAALLLLIACVNVTSLILVRSESRRREIAVRGALGASPARLSCQFVTEALALAVSGCGFGLGIADALMRILKGLVSKDMMAAMPYLDGLAMNAHVLAFAAVLALFAAALFSILPIRHLSRSDLREGLASGARGSTGNLWRRMGANLVVIELAMAVVLLTGAGLLGKSLYRLLHVELGFQPDHLATINVDLPDAAFPDDAQLAQFARRLTERADALPGVQSAGVTSQSPMCCCCNTDWIRLVGQPYNNGVHITVGQRRVNAGFFSALGTRLVSGRYFIDTEGSVTPKVVVVNRTFARKYFPGEDAVGKQFGDTELTPKSIKQIVGVVDDFKEGALDEEISPAIYDPYSEEPSNSFTLIVRTRGDDRALLPELAQIVHEISPSAGTEDPATMMQRIDGSQAAYLHRSMASLVGGFAVIALLLGVVGIYGIVAYSVSRRTQEIGVRMALGAERGAVYRLILKEAGVLIGAGVALGMVGAIAAALPIRKLLFGVQAWDAPTLIGVALVLAGAAFAASFIPARRAASVSPTEALRAE